MYGRTALGASPLDATWTRKDVRCARSSAQNVSATEYTREAGVRHDGYPNLKLSDWMPAGGQPHVAMQLSTNCGPNEPLGNASNWASPNEAEALLREEWRVVREPARRPPTLYALTAPVTAVRLPDALSLAARFSCATSDSVPAVVRHHGVAQVPWPRAACSSSLTMRSGMCRARPSASSIALLRRRVSTSASWSEGAYVKALSHARQHVHAQRWSQQQRSVRFCSFTGDCMLQGVRARVAASRSGGSCRSCVLLALRAAARAGVGAAAHRLGEVRPT